MFLVIWGLFGYTQPGDTNVYAGMNTFIAQFSDYWEQQYESSKNGFRTSQGCVDLSGWYQLYELKAEAEFNKRFSMRYRFNMLRNYDDTITEHRFEPTMMVIPSLYTHLVITPYYKKNYNEAGAGISFRQEDRNWLAFYCLAQRFDHGFSLMYTKPGPDRDLFRRIPFKFEIDARGELEWLRARFHGELGTKANQYLDWPDSMQYVWDKIYDRSRAWGRLELRPFNGFWAGTRFEARLEREETTWPGKNLVTFDTLRYLWLEPFVSFWPTARLELRGAYRFWDVSRKMDSVTYYSDYDILSTLLSWQATDFLLFEAGYQQSKRTRYNNDTTILEPWKGPPGYIQRRLLFALELRLKSGMMLSIKEGIEMNNFPVETFQHPHNHTYVSLYMPLSLLSKDEYGKD